MARTKWSAFGLALSVFPALATPSFGGPFVATRYNEIKLSQEQCLTSAEEVLRKLGFDHMERTRQSRYGTKADHTGVVRCVASNGLVLFIASGPSRQETDGLAGTLYKNFEGGVHR
jgi:hypothetical protein